MAEYHHLYAGKSKTKMRIIMTDVLHKVENYKKALEASPNSTKYNFLRIELAEEDAEKYRRKNGAGFWKAHHARPQPKRVK